MYVAEVRIKGSSIGIATVKTEHEGRGRACFTPDYGESYVLHITKPWGNRINIIYSDFQGIFDEIPFPEVKGEGVSLSTNDTYVDNNIEVNIVASEDGDYRIELYKKMQLISTIEEVKKPVIRKF